MTNFEVSFKDSPCSGCGGQCCQDAFVPVGVEELGLFQNPEIVLETETGKAIIHVHPCEHLDHKGRRDIHGQIKSCTEAPVENPRKLFPDIECGWSFV